MRVINSLGIEISGLTTILPDSARCLLIGKHPGDSEKCPLNNFDEDGDICIPEMCNHYSEEQDE